ncbi:MAG: DUF211 domain-containing protein [Candidatus Diapherotrites archaeon]|nr:DUF211 domain-containing protein [Candidatus Diapherotrites archaeon]
MQEKVVIKRIVLDVMKPHKPAIIEIGAEISALEGIDGCNIALVELDKTVENVKITIEGSDVDFKRLEELLEDNGASIHSIDKVSMGRKSKGIVEEAESRK